MRMPAERGQRDKGTEEKCRKGKRSIEMSTLVDIKTIL